MFFSLASFIAFLPVFLILPSVLAHGHVKSVTIDGTKYDGVQPGDATTESVVRMISTPNPINDVTVPSMSCGQNSQAAKLTAKAKPGSELTFDWASGTNGKWPHNTGPMLLYMADCGDDCAKLDAADAQWFKVSEVGRPAKGQPWKQQDLFDGKTFSVNIPSDISNGKYLVRHEIIGLHIADTKGMVEMYPSCTQIEVTGGSDTKNLPKDTVKFPGAYKQDDPGLYIKNQFDANADYPFPGPDVATFSHDNSTATDDTDNSTDCESDYHSSTSTGMAATTTRATTTATASVDAGGNPVTVTATQFVTVTAASSSADAARPTSTVVTYETVTVAGTPTPAPASASTTASYDSYYRVRRSRIFGKRAGH